MGGQQSTRRISVNNDNTIQVSQEAIDRLQSQIKQSQPTSYEAPPPSLESSQRRQNEYVAEEAYWNRRIDNLRRAHNKINSNMQLEYEKALSQANKLFQQTNDEKFASKLPPCQEEKSKVLQCYKANPDQSLMCSVLVSAFSECVSNSRVSSVAAST